MAISIRITINTSDEYKEVLSKYMPSLSELPESSVTIILDAKRQVGKRSFFDDLERESMYRKEVEHAITHL